MRISLGIATLIDFHCKILVSPFEQGWKWKYHILHLCSEINLSGVFFPPCNEVVPGFASEAKCLFLAQSIFLRNGGFDYSERVYSYIVSGDGNVNTTLKRMER